MKENDSQHELLLRHFDGRSTPEERLRVVELLRSDPEARAFLREVAEQAVIVADLERIALGRQEALRERPTRSADHGRRGVSVKFRVWLWGPAVAAMIAILAVVAFEVLPIPRPLVVRVSKMSGSSQYFGSNGKSENELSVQAALSVGDTLETRSCDASIALDLGDGSTLTIAGRSTLRLLEAEAGANRFKLLLGNLWVSPAHAPGGEPMEIHTPIGSVEARSAQLDVQSSSTEMIVRVNEGSARVRRYVDGGAVDVPRGHQVTVSLSKKEPLAVIPQPKPINFWACDLWQVPEVILGKWLPSTGNERARLGAEPLLWPIPDRDPLMLYAVSLAAWKSSEWPVLLHSTSRLRFRGRTERAHTVRFGFSTQKMRGIFSGKFELDVNPDALGPAGETWEIDLPLTRFRPLHPHLSSSPDGFELTDVYALTVRDDAGLEINHIELLPQE